MNHRIRLTAPVRDLRPAPPPGSPEWDERAAERERAAYERGRIDGERALSEQLVQQRAELIHLQNGVLASLRQALPGLLAQSEQSLIELALTVARRLVANLPIDAALVQAVVREALAELEHAAAVLVVLHPDDLDLLRRINAPLLLEQVGGEPLRFQASPDVARGGCLLQTSFGVVDATRENKLERLGLLS
ncbi:MAG: FliH/SctL family protein [Verrucomicrobiota bacterium]